MFEPRFKLTKERSHLSSLLLGVRLHGGDPRISVDSRSSIGSNGGRYRCPRSQAPGAPRDVRIQGPSSPPACKPCVGCGVAPSGLRVAAAADLQRAQEDARLLRLIRASFVASQGIYGAPRVFLDLREAGETCSKHRVARLMREANLRALHGYRTRRWSVGKPSVLIPNLLQRQFTVSRPNTVWVTEDHLYSDLAGLALQGRNHGPVLAQGRRLGGGAHDSPRTRAQRCAHGGAPSSATRHDDPLGPRHSIRLRRVATILPQTIAWSRA